MKYALLVSCLFAGAFALPGPKPVFDIEDDVSQYFDQNFESRIVGGDIAAEGSVPYMVALTNGMIVRGLVCGGSIVSPTFVLTAAHCIDPVYNRETGLSPHLRGTVGTNLFNRGGEMYSFSRNISHEHYDRPTIKNDIGFLITIEPIRFGPIVSVIPLSFEYVGGGVAARAAGYGRIQAGGALSQALLELTLNTLSGEQCVEDVRRYREQMGITGGVPVDPLIEICTFHSVGHGVCNGDSGSALVRRDTTEQIGIVSWAFLCARGAPDMFVRVSAYSDWIQNHMNAA